MFIVIIDLIYTVLLLYIDFVTLSASLAVSVHAAFSTALSLHLQPTSQRLGAVAASTNVHAGDNCSITHNFFRGVSAAIAPNRKL
jgi:hypothetical protein